MKKHLLAAGLTLTMLALSLSGCAAKEREVPIAEEELLSEVSEAFSEVEEAADSGLDPVEIIDSLLKKQGKVYNIYTYDRKLVSVMKNYLPEYLTEEEMTISEAGEADSGMAEAESAASGTEHLPERTISQKTEAEMPDTQTAVTDDKPDTGAADDPTVPEEDLGGDEAKTADGIALVTAQIGDITIRWHIIEDNLSHYQDVLDEALMNQDAPSDEQVDLFLVDGAMAAKYCDADADVAKPLKKIGITDEDLQYQYRFTQQLVSDENGEQRGTTWQVPCGVFVYRRSIAQAVLGTDNPVQVQKEVGSWDRFNELAARMAEQNYKMLSGYTDTFYAALGQKEKSWVNENDQLQMDDSLRQWVEMTKHFTEQGYNNGSDGIYSEAWQQDQRPGSPVFGFFLSSWGVSHYLLPDSLAVSVKDGGLLEAGNGNYGDWAVCQGPSAFYQGGSWLCAATTSDNDKLTGELMRTLTCDEATLLKMTTESGELTNHMKAMSQAMQVEVPMRAFFGGQDYLRLFDKAARDLDVSRAGYYDSGINACCISAFIPYFKGEIDEQTALADFYQNVMERYPDLLGA